jgi:hypothetical protein
MQKDKLESYSPVYFRQVLYFQIDKCHVSVTLREERRLMVWDNRALWKIFGPRRDEVTGGVEKAT